MPTPLFHHGIEVAQHRQLGIYRAGCSACAQARGLVVSTCSVDMDKRLELKVRADELGITLDRFSKLQSVYTSDLQRLPSIEEGGFVLVAMAGMACPVCGPPPEAQQHNHATAEIDMAHKAAAAEANKIELEQRELPQAMISLAAEAEGL